MVSLIRKNTLIGVFFIPIPFFFCNYSGTMRYWLFALIAAAERCQG
jgi:hypothetical protein